MKYCRRINSQIIGRIDYHEQISAAEKVNRSCIENDNRKVLIIHTGGTIGMFKDEQGKFKPEKDRFKTFLQTYPYFCDENQTYFSSQDGFTITPHSIFKKKIWYKYFEMANLIDSTNMNIVRLNMILQLIKQNYDKYDAFIIFHGTDTMSYTASALSFMIENLKKTIIITGAQVPIGETRNDSINNILCALTIAGHYIIPQVLLVFDNTIMRGNRTKKSSASSFSSFKSPNFYPIGQLGLKIEIRWQLIMPCRYDQPTIFHELSEEVQLIKLTPFGFLSKPSTKYLVIESYGVGNIPTEGVFYDWVKQNAKKNEEERIVIVNISQVEQSVILNIYATGYQAEKLGLISGSDMTCEAAASKLSFLASKKLNYKQIKTMMLKNMRGELTEIEDRIAMQRQNFVFNCMVMLDKGFNKQSQNFKDLLRNIVYPNLILQKISKPNLVRMVELGFDINYVYPDGGNLLHYFCKQNGFKQDSDSYLEYLLENKIDAKLIDKSETSALFYAIELQKWQEADLIYKRGGIVATSTQRIFQAIRNNELNLLMSLAKYGDEFAYQNSQGRNCLIYALLCGKKQICQFFKYNSKFFDQARMKQKDIYGKNLKFYLETSKIQIN